MKMDGFELLYELGEVSDYLVIESKKNSPQMKERIIVRWATSAASVCLVMMAAIFAWCFGGRGGVGPIIPGDTIAPVGTESRSDDDYPRDTDTTADTTADASGGGDDSPTDTDTAAGAPVTQYKISQDPSTYQIYTKFIRPIR